MIVKVWGSRGSTPVSGSEFKTFGYDTPCVEVRTNAGQTIILDAGTGLGAYARENINKDKETPIICLSHLHMDHIQGLPFYSPIYQKPMNIYGPRPESDEDLATGLGRMFDGVLLPMRLDTLKAPYFHEVKSGDKFQIGNAVLETIATNHPGESLAWKIRADGQTLVYTGDHEIPINEADKKGMETTNALLDFMADADIVLVDGHFTKEDHEAHPGWGHSHFSQWPEELARRKVKNLIFTHFSPAYTDNELESIINKLRQENHDLNIMGAQPDKFFSCENQALTSASTDTDCLICAFFQRAASLSDTHSVIASLLEEARKWANADAGTIYLLEKDELVFAASQNDTLFPKSASNKFAYMNARIPVNRASIAGFVAETGNKLNLSDVYHLPEGTEYSFNQDFDKNNGYRTKSVLCVPLVNSKKKIIGVMQLINSQHDGVVLPFSQRMEDLVSRLASMATIPLEKSLLVTSIILRMLQTSALRDPRETAGHVYRVGSIAAEIYHRWAEKHGVEPEELLTQKGRLRLAAMLHDIGKVGIPDAVLKKPGRLDDNEREIMQQHSALGASLFADGISEIDRMARNIALHHHAKWDGSGYTGTTSIPSPSGDQIPLEARITAIADVYDALVSKRCYKDAWDVSKALEILHKDAGSHFDPELVQCFEEIQDTVQAIMQRYSDPQAA